jgi:hypothetical protein
VGRDGGPPLRGRQTLNGGFRLVEQWTRVKAPPMSGRDSGGEREGVDRQMSGDSVTNWPNIRPHNSKRGPNKNIGQISADFVQKGPKKGVELLESLISFSSSL